MVPAIGAGPRPPTHRIRPRRLPGRRTVAPVVWPIPRAGPRVTANNRHTPHRVTRRPQATAPASDPPSGAERKAHLHRHRRVSGAFQVSGRCQVQRRVRLAHVRAAHPRMPAPPMRPRGAPPTRSTVSPHVGGHPPPPLAATSRADHRPVLAERNRPEPPCPHPPPATPNRTSRRRAAPAPTGTLRSPTRGVHPRGPHAHRRTGAPAREGCRTTSSPAPPSPDEQCVPSQPAMSGAAPGSASSLAVAVPRSPRSYRASAEPPPTRTTVSRPTEGHPPPHLAAMSRADHRRAPRGAPPTRTAVSPRAASHDHPPLAAASRARPDRHHAEPDPRGSPTRTTRPPPPHARSSALLGAEHAAHLHCQDEVSMTTVADGGVRCSAGFGSLTSAPRIRGCPRHRCGHAEHRRPGAPCRRTSEATHHRHLAAMSRADNRPYRRSTTDPTHRVPRHHRPRPPHARGGEPRHTPTGTTRSPTRGVHPRGPHAHRRTRPHAREGCRTSV
ncbi:hypothetical protein GobsT_11520 [Gemmata obscuriglobus]|nr:hypothetical protein GobsT_11520 [Gemmata obscuriglobus]VTS01528.1 unnamed protein product [Gemmata obscuriglobus UQM 2246]